MEEEIGMPIGVLIQSLLVGGRNDGETVTNELPVPRFIWINERIESNPPYDGGGLEDLRRLLMEQEGNPSPPFDFKSRYLVRHVYEAEGDGMIYNYRGWFQG